MRFCCPGCNVKLKAKPEQAGKRFRCPKCSTEVTVPAVDETGAGASLASAPPETKEPSPIDTPSGVGWVERSEDPRGAYEGAASAEDAVPEVWKPGDVILDLYEVREVVGQGGFGTVYRVHHRGWNVDLAVKSPRPGLFQSEREKKRFIAECETWVNLGLHPHTVSCHYVRTLGGIPRVFAEYVEGGSLKDWIAEGRLLPSPACGPLI